MEEINLLDLTQFVNQKLGLESKISTLTDGRERPQIPAPVIFQSVLYGTILGVESLLAMDQFLKQSDLGAVLQTERAPLVSDSTMIRSLSTMDASLIQAMVREVAQQTLELALQMKERLSMGPWRVIAMDMSQMAGRKAVVARYVSERVESVLDYEIVGPKENEVTAAKRLLPRVVSHFAPFFDVVVVDGLYTQWFIQIVRDAGKHIVVKTREEPKNLNLVRLGEEWIAVHQRYGVEPTQGVDEDGYKSYRYQEIDPQQDALLSEPIRMVKVWEQRIKGRQDRDEHWLLSTLPRAEAPAELLRQIARRRWGIETGFRTVKQNHKGRRKGTQQGQAAEVRVGILLLAETVLRGYTWWKEVTWKSPRSRRSSWLSIQKLLMRSVPPLRQVRGVKPLSQPHWGLQGLRQQQLQPTGTDSS